MKLSKLEPIGLSLFILGSFLYYMHWPFGTLLLTLAVLTIVIGILFEGHKTNSFTTIGENYTLIIFVISSMFWIVNYPGAATMKTLGITSLALLFVFRLAKSIRIAVYWNKVLSILINTTFIFLCISFIFNYQAWPYRSIIMVFTFLNFALCSTLFYILSIDKVKHEEFLIKATPRNITILAIGLLIIYFNLLNKIPISTQITSFNECKEIQKEKSELIKRGISLSKLLTNSFSINLVNKINKLTDKQLEHLQLIKIEILNQSSNDTVYQMYKSGNKVVDLIINFDNLNHSFNYDIPMYLFQSKASNKNKTVGEELHENLFDYQNKLISTLKNVKIKVIKNQLEMIDSNYLHYQNIELESIKSNFYFLNIERTNEYQADNWVDYHFDHLTLINTLQKISNIERCILKSRVEALLFLTKKQGIK